jgi:hypothetical protein
VQAIGGASASGASAGGYDANSGARIMLWGIIVQLSMLPNLVRLSQADSPLVALTIYLALGADFIWRYHFDKPVRVVPESSVSTVQEKVGHPMVDKSVKIMLAGLIINSVFLLIRRVVHLEENFMLLT